MKTIQPFTLLIKSRKSFDIPQDMLSAIRLHARMLPMYMPKKWGWYESSEYPFNPEHIDTMVCDNGTTDDVWWKRTGKNRARGAFTTWSRFSPVQQHSTIDIEFYDTKYQTELLDYLKAATLLSMGDFSLLDGVATEYFEFAKASHLVVGYARFDLKDTWRIFLPSHHLFHWLPDMPWAGVFGLSYVKLFGKEKLLATPAFKVEEIGEDMVFIQLTEKMEDIHLQYEEVMQARYKAKAHLGREHFFNLEQGYSLEVADFTSGYAKQQEAINAKAGKVFTVPSFAFFLP